MGVREENREKPSGAVWDVFAKTRKDKALHHIGDVLAPSPGLAKAYAYQMYQESTWQDMVAVARESIVTLVEDGEPTGARSGDAGQWEVYGRRRGEEALSFIGVHEGALATVLASHGAGWLEVAAFQGQDAVTVLAKGQGAKN